MGGDQLRHALVALRAGMGAVVGLGLGQPQAVRRERAEDVDEGHLQPRTEQLQILVERLRAGGGQTAIERQHAKGRLTAREREVLQKLAEGLVAKEIATALDVSVYTVDAHRGRIMKKLGLKSSAEIVKFAMRKGLVV